MEEPGQASEAVTRLSPAGGGAVDSLSCKAVWRSAALMAAIAFAVFCPSLFIGYFMDDFSFLEQARETPFRFGSLVRGYRIGPSRFHDGWHAGGLGSEGIAYFRPFFLACLKLSDALGKGAPWVAHLLSLAMHAAAVASLFLIARELWPGRRGLSFGAALLFGFHPQTYFTVIWVSGQTDLSVGCFGLLCLLGFLRFRRRRRRWAHVLSLAAMAMALMCKENAVALPAVLLAADYLLAPQERLGIRHHLGYFALAGGYLWLRTAALGGFPTPPVGNYYHPLGAEGTIPYALAKGVVTLGALFFLGPSYPFLPEALLAHRAALGIYGAAVVVAVGWIVRRIGWRAALFPGIWLAAAFAPTALVMNNPNHHYLQIPPVCLIYGSLAGRLTEGCLGAASRRRLERVGRVLLLLLGLAGFGVSWAGNVLGRSARRPAEQVVACLPDPPAGASIYLFNVPVPSYAIGAQLRLLYGRKDIRTHVMAYSPSLLDGIPSQLDRVGPGTLRLTALGRAYASDSATRAVYFKRGRIRENARFETAEYDFFVDKVDWGKSGPCGVRAFRYEFNEPLEARPRFFFMYGEDGAQRLWGPEAPPPASAAGAVRERLKEGSG